MHNLSLPTKASVSPKKDSVPIHASRPFVVQPKRREAQGRKGAQQPNLSYGKSQAAQLDAGLMQNLSIQLKRGGRSGAPSQPPRLAYDQPITAANIQGVKELKEGSVFQLTSAAGDKLIIRLEPYTDPTESEYRARNAVTNEFAALALPGTPGIRELTTKDRDAILGTSAATVVEQDLIALIELKKLVREVQNGEHKAVFFKAEHVDAGESVGNTLNPKNPPAPDTQEAIGLENKQNSLMGKLEQQGHWESLGRMAVFDIIVGNGDRFRTQNNKGDVNPENIDIGQHGPVSVDNVDPYAPWFGQVAVQQAVTPLLAEPDREQYADAVFKKIVSRKKLGDFGPLLEQAMDGVAQPAFVKGMDEGIHDMRKLKSKIRKLKSREKDKDKKKHLKELGDRLKLLPKL